MHLIMELLGPKLEIYNFIEWSKILNHLHMIFLEILRFKKKAIMARNLWFSGFFLCYYLVQYFKYKINAILFEKFISLNPHVQVDLLSYKWKSLRCGPFSPFECALIPAKIQDSQWGWEGV